MKDKGKKRKKENKRISFTDEVVEGIEELMADNEGDQRITERNEGFLEKTFRGSKDELPVLVT